MCPYITVLIRFCRDLHDASDRLPRRPAYAKVRKDQKPDYSYLLTAREKRVVKALNAEYTKRFNQNPENDEDLVYYLGDNEGRKCWSAVSGKIPTLRMAGGLTWSVKRKRFLTGREKLGTLGFPITPGTAKALKVHQLPVTDVKRCSQIAGNCMHWTSIGVIQLIALVSIKSVVQKFAARIAAEIFTEGFVQAFAPDS